MFRSAFHRLCTAAIGLSLACSGGCAMAKPGKAYSAPVEVAAPVVGTPSAPPGGTNAFGGSAGKAGAAELAAFTPEKSAAATPANRMLVYNAQLTVAVAEPDAAMQKAEALAAEMGGYVQKIEGRRETLRVPAARFREAVAKLGAYGAVTNRNIEAQDITEEYMDLELRLTNARAIRKRLEELLEKAKDVKDTLEVEKELNRVREEIERLEGRINYLSKQVAFSTIVVEWTLIERTVTRGKKLALPFPWLHELGVETLIRTGRP